MIYPAQSGECAWFGKQTNFKAQSNILSPIITRLQIHVLKYVFLFFEKINSVRWACCFESNLPLTSLLHLQAKKKHKQRFPVRSTETLTDLVKWHNYPRLEIITSNFRFLTGQPHRPGLFYFSCQIHQFSFSLAPNSPSLSPPSSQTLSFSCFSFLSRSFSLSFSIIFSLQIKDRPNRTWIFWNPFPKVTIWSIFHLRFSVNQLQLIHALYFLFLQIFSIMLGSELIQCMKVFLTVRCVRSICCFDILTLQCNTIHCRFDNSICIYIYICDFMYMPLELDLWISIVEYFCKMYMLLLYVSFC